MLEEGEERKRKREKARKLSVDSRTVIINLI